jgi:hypothetical protein
MFLEYVFLIFWTYFLVKKKKKSWKKVLKYFFFTLVSGILYEPFLLLDAPIDAAFTAGEADNVVVEDDEDAVRGRPVGHIHERADFWLEHLHPDPYVRGILDHDFKVPVDWNRIPESYEEQDNVSAVKNYDFVREEVARLVDSGQVVKCDVKPRCCNPLSVAVKLLEDGSSKKRLVLDLSRCMNLAVEDDRYRMTTLQDAINSTRKGDFQVVFDLKSAFHHARLHADSYKLMGFKVVDKEGVTRYYVYVVLVFGFKKTAQVLGRVLKPVIIFLIQNGIPVTLYIDDGLLVGPSKDRVMKRYIFALDVFNKGGLLINIEKSMVPEDANTKVMFLGVFIDTMDMCIHASLQKVKLLREAIAATLRVYGSIPVRRLASLVGKLVALEVAFGPPILVGTRMVSIQISQASDQFGWEKGFVVLSKDSQAALRRVSASLDLWYGHPMRTPASEITLTSVLAFKDPAGTVRKIPNRRLCPAQFTMASDASETTVASYGLSGRLRSFQFTQALLPHERAESSTHREMSAVFKTLLCCQNELRMTSTTTLWWLTDSENVARIFRRGSGDLSLMQLALQVLEMALKLNLDFQAHLGFEVGPEVAEGGRLN